MGKKVLISKWQCVHCIYFLYQPLKTGAVYLFERIFFKLTDNNQLLITIKTITYYSRFTPNLKTYF